MRFAEEDLPDYLIENDPAFKTRIAEAYAEYTPLGGMPIDELIKKLEVANSWMVLIW